MTPPGGTTASIEPLKPSAIKPVITTIEKGLVIKAMGKLVGEDQRALREAVGVIVE